MRTRIIIYCGIVLAACLWLLWWQHAKVPKPIAGPEAVAVSTNPPVVESQSVNPPPAVAGQPSQPPTSVPQSTPKTGMELYSQMRSNLLSPERKARLEQFQEAWRTPIEFYGKVVDENTNPVAGVQVDFGCNDLSPTGTSYYHTESDANGLFSIKDITGKLLNIHVSKEGYYSSKSDSDSFYYAGENVNFVPDQSNPIIFHLRKKGARAKLVEVKQNYGIARDGTALGIDLTTGKAATGGSGNLVVQCWTEDAGKSSGQKYDWHCLVTIPGGGLVLSSGEFDFSAPEDGYAPSY